ncbi:hypothetical protein [Listeria booriae]|uniref:Uncharacterized protein n=1 Tax=Listeria booriae TaxID=1552123 RepID=A0A7X0XQX1_9LIST|nr:hypothetical protein [Listeria booriae]MBC1778944.1 hypothetical protein [Listeria booriae]
MNNQITRLDWSYNKLYNGCMLASVAHAIMVAHFPDIANEHSWDGINYSVQDSAGMRGTITFQRGFCVAAFRDDNSTRLEQELTKAQEYFDGAPNGLYQLAENEALQYLLDSVDGNTVPVITTAFWGHNDDFSTTDTIDSMLENGGILLERQLMPIDESFESWKDYYEMSETQMDLLHSIYARLIQNEYQTITLSKDEIEMIGAPDLNGIEASRESFNEIGIQLEA